MKVKLLLTMQLFSVCLLTTGLCASAAGFSQKLTLAEQNAPMEKVFRDIHSRTGLDFFYTDEMLKASKPVTVDLKEAELADVLAACFEGQPLTYTIRDRIIVIKLRPPAPSSAVAPAFYDIHGRVTDSLGNPMAGASVTVKGAKRGVETDANGMFELKSVVEGAVLVVSFTGFETKEYRIRPGHPLLIVLMRSNSPLDEIQVIAYGTTTQRFNTGNVTTVKSADIEKQPVGNPLLALEGRVPGLFITESAGLPGSAVAVHIEGQNSISKGNNPLYVIDGVPYSANLLPNYGSIFQTVNGGEPSAGPGNPFSYINPSDIQTVEVLKDADATAIYGSRAANGAILITTKKGMPGRTRVEANLQNGWGAVTRMMDVMNIHQYLEMRHEAKQYANASILSTDYDINGTWDTTRNVNWQKTLIGGTAQYTDAQMNLSGGSAATQYLIGANYHRETTVFPGTWPDQKGSLHFNINSTSENQKFHLQFTGSYLFDLDRIPSVDMTQDAVRLAPDAPDLNNPDGSINWAPNALGMSTWTTPITYLLKTYQNKVNNLIGNSVISYEVLPGLTLKSSFGYTNMQQNDMSLNPTASIVPERRNLDARYAVFSNNNINTWIIEPQLTYNRRIGNGRLEFLAGSTIQQNNKNGAQIFATGYSSDLALPDIKSASSVTYSSSVLTEYKYEALFGRLNYNWKEKFIVNITGRRDGSSRFGSANLFHNFGSGALAWIFSNEDYFKRKMPFLSFGKIRGSFGTTGNDQIGDYQFLSLFSSVSSSTPYQGTNGLAPTGLPNPYLQWEETRKLQFGLDLGFFRNRVLLNANYYFNRTSNQLQGYALPVIAGFGNITENLPATVQNSGWEVTLATTNIRAKNFSWTSSFNLTVPQNKLVSYPNLSKSSVANSYIIGQPITIVRVFHFLGVDPATGIYTYADAHGTPTLAPNYSTDRVKTVKQDPAFYGGLDNTIRYKGLELDFLLQFVKQVGANYFYGNYAPGLFFSGPQSANSGNQPKTVINRWHKPGDIAVIGAASSAYSSAMLTAYFDAASSDAGYSDASYIRLKNISLSWQLPDAWQKKAHFQQFSIFVHAQNLFVITRFVGMDPESRSSRALPPLRVLTAGLRIAL